MSWRDCFKLQEIRPGYTASRTVFGRAKYITGYDPIYSEHPAYYMIYWLRLPVFGFRPLWDRDECGWQQAVVVLHGKHGFRIVWWDVRAAGASP